MPRFRSEPFQLLSSPLLLHFSAFSLPCPSVHTHWQQLQSQWDALHSWQRKNTAAGERKQIQIWHCPLPSCSVRAPVKTDLPVWFLNHCKLLFSVYLLRINPCLRRGRPCVDCHAFEFMQRALQDLKKTAYNLDTRTETLLLRAEKRGLCDCFRAIH
uniref:NELL2-interacting cell ontogeny regulator 1 n=1 Tax=Corvus moneduloides TaxID=1196302 RepID=A0A8C3EBQ7_CORMO